MPCHEREGGGEEKFNVDRKEELSRFEWGIRRRRASSKTCMNVCEKATKKPAPRAEIVMWREGRGDMCVR